jgi:hypothetical protein
MHGGVSHNGEIYTLCNDIEFKIKAKRNNKINVTLIKHVIQPEIYSLKTPKRSTRLY